jgi:hypothetical protein
MYCHEETTDSSSYVLYDVVSDIGIDNRWGSSSPSDSLVPKTTVCKTQSLLSGLCSTSMQYSCHMLL